MKEYLRRPEGMAETAAAEVVGGNRAALKSRAPVVTRCCSSRKRRKVSSHCGSDGEEVTSGNSVSVREPVTSKCSSCESSESVKENLRNVDLKVELQHLCLHLLFDSLLFQISSVSQLVLIARN